MAHQLGTMQTAPRAYGRHQRHARFARVKHQGQFKTFLTTEATRLSSTNAVIFAKLDHYTARRVAVAVNLAAIP